MIMELSGSWSLILGVSSGFGQATAHALAQRGGNVIGVHFDTAERAEAAAEFAGKLRATGVDAHFFNLNAASAGTRREVIGQATELTGDQGIRILLHSLAFGSLLPFVPVEDGRETVSPKQLATTLDVMANSLVHWVRDLLAADLIRRGAKIYGMTSEGGGRVLPSYGAISAAKAALESHLRQLALELAPRGIAANAVRAGTTITPAQEKIPNSAEYAEVCRKRNPHHRLTETEDVAEAIVLLSMTDSSWITGNVIGVDGGELIAG
jgi:enoyl-[acyl-carrier protein] reductase III